jgi:predicted esterase
MGSNGPVFCQGLLPFAAQHQLLLLAPTFNYNPDYKNPQVVAAEDLKLSVELNQMVSELANRTHLQLKPQILLFGFSRGAQLSHHYAMFYPELTLGVTIFSGGAYTVPLATLADKPEQELPYPLGVSDLANYIGHPFDQAAFAKIPFNIGVGGADNDPSQVSRAWDAVLGTDRLHRAQNYYHDLQKLGVQAQLTVFPNTGHTVSPTMTAQALTFYQDLLDVSQN